VLFRTHRELSCTLIERDCFEFELLVDVDGLEDVIRLVEYYERIAGDVSLEELRISPGSVAPRMMLPHNDLVALPQAMADSLQFRLRPPG
jgi:hypothetical protein